MNAADDRVVLILDGDERSTLAVARSLGRNGFKVLVGAIESKSLSGASKYCSKQVTYSNPATNEENFIVDIVKICDSCNVNYLIPITDFTTEIVLRNKSRFCNVNLPIGSYDSYNALTNKYDLFRLAEEIGIRIPDTRFITPGSDLNANLSNLKFPIVLKPFKSRIIENNSLINTRVFYANSLDDAANIINNSVVFQRYPFLIQEFIEGAGQGVFTLRWGKDFRLWFAHKRVKERPPSGGVGVQCESIELNEQMKESAIKLLDKVDWNGVAMVEFKVDEFGTPYLMEVNARFWGSLNLAVNSGADFPMELIHAVEGCSHNKKDGYKVGCKNRWVLGELDRLYLMLFKKDKYFKQTESLFTEVFNFLNIFSKNTFYDSICFDDIGPFLYEFKSYLKRS